MAELVDALDLGSSVSRRAGSSPALRTLISEINSIGRVSPFQGEGCGFESRISLRCMPLVIRVLVNHKTKRQVLRQDSGYRRLFYVLAC